MRIAIPTFGLKISPRFDFAARLLIVEVQGSDVLDRNEDSIEHLHGQRRIGHLTGQGVNVLLCGGIRLCDHISIESAGIDVYAGLMGSVDDVLNAFLRGNIRRNTMDGESRPARGRRARRRARHQHRSAGYSRRLNDGRS